MPAGCLACDLHRLLVDLDHVLVAPKRIEEQRARRIGIGGDDLGARSDIVGVNLAHDIGVGKIGLRAPRVAAHRHAALLDVGAGAAVEDNHLAAFKLVLDLPVRHHAHPARRHI
jgi:hypothetical protein